MQHLYQGVVWRLNPSLKVVYLTFDDGPVPECTPQVLDILQHYGVKATFFMVGENAKRYPDLLERVRREGHSVGNHTYHHLKGCTLSTKTYMENINYADELLQTPLFRPPYGRMRGSEKKAVLQAGYRIFLWDVLTHDYNAAYTEEHLLSVVQHYTRNGSIITFHDSLKTTPRLERVLPRVIEWLQQAGYQCCAIPLDR